MKITVIGLSLSSAWGNGHATTYRSLLRALHERGHEIAFLERDTPWYQGRRDLIEPPYCALHLYSSLEQLKDEHLSSIREADAVIVGSYVPDGVTINDLVLSQANGVTAFYDIDTPVTLAKLAQGREEYISKRQICEFDIYLTFAGGPCLAKLTGVYGSPMARALYCSVDSDIYYPDPCDAKFDLGYLGTYSVDRQSKLESLLIDPARLWTEGQFVVAGSQYPREIAWPENVHRVDHVTPDEHRHFYNTQRFSLNLTRADMVVAGFSPSVRLFECAACGVPLISDWWNGLDGLFELGAEVLIAENPNQVLRYLREITEESRLRIGERARSRVMEKHTHRHRAAELERYLSEAAACDVHAATIPLGQATMKLRKKGSSLGT